MTQQEQETKIAEHLIGQVVARGLGTASDECIGNHPRDVYFIGNLRPIDAEEDASKVAVRELLTKLAPTAMGFEIAAKTSTKRVALEVQLSWTLYYRRFATWDQQSKYQRRPDFSSPDTLLPTKGPDDGMLPRFVAIRCMAESTVSFSAESGPACDLRNLEQAIKTEIQRATHVWRSDDTRLRTRTAQDEFLKVPLSALQSLETYNNFLSSLTTEVQPQWNIGLESSIRRSEEGDGFVIGIDATNTSPSARLNPNLEHFIFNPVFTFTFVKGEPLPFTLDLAPKGFRFDRHLWGKGFNCGLQRDLSNPLSFKTTHTPIYRQHRYATRITPPAPFAELASNPIPVLELIHSDMVAYVAEWSTQRKTYEAQDPSWNLKHGEEYEKDLRSYEDEISRFQNGLELIRKDKDVEYAFKLTNEAFRRGSKQGWRLFQIVFLVTQLASMEGLKSGSAAQERKKVDIIYFPTGGGKTEAYLAVLVFHCFFDRLRGKKGGVTAWTRFPLRLLTLQQTQRVADVIGVSELIRQEQKDPRLSGKGVDSFAVGYFVGEGGSPNELANPSKAPYPTADQEISWLKANDSKERQKWKRVVRCPACRTNTVFVDFDSDKVRLIHRCSNKQCRFKEGVVPVLVVDNEIYRDLPSIIVGTIDKLAGIGNQRKMALMLGKVDGRCKVHGYFKQKCCQKDCTDSKLLVKGDVEGVSGPTLFVQDELHLLKEGLGTFDSHYETFTQVLLKEFGANQPLKIIASSATIEAFERQVAHLYGRASEDARVFPGVGPTLAKSFYAETLDYDQRLYVGLIPHNKTIFNAILEIIEYYHRSVQSIATGPNPSSLLGNRTSFDKAQWGQLIDLYSTSLTYFLNNRELNSIKTDMIGHMYPSLEHDGLTNPRIHELTGGATTDEVQNSLETLEQGASGKFQSDAILATSMVSHGVDIDRLNAMIFYGMPRQNAEYIQASSRVGRSHVGIVFNCLHPARERDQSHFEYFVKFHEFLGQLVEPVAINRWAKFSLDRTCPGLFMAILLQEFANAPNAKADSFYALDFVRKKISAGEITTDRFIELLERAYLLDQGIASVDNEVAVLSFRSEVHRLVNQFLDQIISGSSQYKFVSEVLIPKPMRSLRDVDEPIDIELDSNGTEWARRAAANRGD